MTHNIKYQTKNTITVGVGYFKCPIPTCLGHVPLDPASIAAHLNAKHKQIANKMHLTGRPADKAYAFFCKSCESYTNKLHAICHECKNSEYGSASRCFPSKEALNAHLKTDHTKWWFEYKCKFGKECHGIQGGCGFVHHDIPKTFITLDEPLPPYLCRYERPWEGVRCNSDQCSFAHLWGRVRFLIKSRGPKTTPATQLHSGSDSNEDVKTQVENQKIYQTPQLTIEVPPFSGAILKPELFVSPIPRDRDACNDCSFERAEFESVVKKLETVFKQVAEEDKSNGVKQIDEKVDQEPDAPTQSRPAKDDDWDEQYDDYECDEDEDQYSAYDFQMPTRGGGGGGKQKQGPYTTRHVRIQEENLARARQRSVVKNAERFQKKFSGSA